MVRPPQPATYLYVFECTASAVQSGYIARFARAMVDSLDAIPGDSRTMLGFLAFDSKLHFFNLNEDRPVHYIMPDIEGKKEGTCVSVLQFPSFPNRHLHPSH